MKFLAVIYALVISAGGIKVKTTDHSKEKEGLKTGGYDDGDDDYYGDYSGYGD